MLFDRLSAQNRHERSLPAAGRKARHVSTADPRHAGLRGRFTDTDVADVAQLAAAGLIQSADSAA